MEDVLDELGKFFAQPEERTIVPLDPVAAEKVRAATVDTAEELLAAWDRGESVPFVDIAPSYATARDRMVTEAACNMPFGHVAVRHGPCVIAIETVRLLCQTHPEQSVLLRNSETPEDLPEDDRIHMNNLLRQMLFDLDRYDPVQRAYTLGGVTAHQERVGISMGLMLVRHGHRALMENAIEQGAVFWADHREVLPYYRQCDELLKAKQPDSAMAN